MQFSNRKRTILAAISVCIMTSLLLAGTAVIARPHHGVFTVAPSGDVSGVEDTTNIQQALDDAITAGGGSTVLLEEGDYYLCETIVGVNFDGTFKGAGAGLTVLHSVENFPAQDTGNLGTANPRMLMFYQDESSTSTANDPYKIKLHDFSLKVDQPTEAWYYGLFRGMNVLDIYGKVDGQSTEDMSYFDATVKNVEFLGDVGDEYGYFGLSIQNALLIQGEWGAEFVNERISGKYVVEGCHFQNSLGSSVMFGSFGDSHIRIVRNTYQDTMIGPELYDLDNSHAEVAFNEVTGVGWFGVYVCNGLYATSLEPSRVLIHHNHIECAPGGTGIWLDDYLAVPGEVEGISVFALHNQIVLNDPYSWGIFGYGAQKVWLVHNTISGSGEAGIVTGIWGDAVEGWKLVLNDLSDFNAEVADIWLGPGTSHCWLIHRGPSASVLDEGTDNWLLLLP
ncbi:MAG: hypothetical protein Q6361_00690 [Candidatus Hermodarchaeota archaeon]|nr:hypothetical protein [Candidatus Hermodarchaeota archaeon]